MIHSCVHNIIDIELYYRCSYLAYCDYIIVWSVYYSHWSGLEPFKWDILVLERD